MNTWMTMACGWQLRFAGTSAVRDGFTDGGRGGGEFGSQTDNWHMKCPGGATLVNTSSGGLHSVCAFVIKAEQWVISISLPALGALENLADLVGICFTVCARFRLQFNLYLFACFVALWNRSLYSLLNCKLLSMLNYHSWVGIMKISLLIQSCYYFVFHGQ